MKDKKIIFWIIFSLMVILVIIGFALNRISNKMCEKECNQMNALAHEIYPSGNWKLDDVCMCIFPDKIKSFKLNNQKGG